MMPETGTLGKMAKKAERRQTGISAVDDFSGFPDTQTEVLAQAAAGNWEPFFDAYLRPCWREVVMACRARQIALPDADDLYQELMLRLIQDGGFNRQIRDMLAQEHEDPKFRANLPGRYLRYREMPLQSARFRTYLKRVIENLVLEAVRKAQRRPKQLRDQESDPHHPWIEESITGWLDRQAVSECLAKAALQFQTDCAAAGTRGRRRLFEILYLSTVEGQSPGMIAEKYGVDRSTVSGMLTEARGRFAAKLGQIAGISDTAELGELLADSMDELKNALMRAYTNSQT